MARPTCALTSATATMPHFVPFTLSDVPHACAVGSPPDRRIRAAPRSRELPVGLFLRTTTIDVEMDRRERATLPGLRPDPPMRSMSASPPAGAAAENSRRRTAPAQPPFLDAGNTVDYTGRDRMGQPISRRTGCAPRCRDRPHGGFSLATVAAYAPPIWIRFGYHAINGRRRAVRPTPSQLMRRMLFSARLTPCSRGTSSSCGAQRKFWSTSRSSERNACCCREPLATPRPSRRLSLSPQ